MSSTIGVAVLKGHGLSRAERAVMRNTALAAEGMVVVQEHPSEAKAQRLFILAIGTA
jgi:hypothetical protein